MSRIQQPTVQEMEMFARAQAAQQNAQREAQWQGEWNAIAGELFIRAMDAHQLDHEDEAVEREDVFNLAQRCLLAGHTFMMARGLVIPWKAPTWAEVAKLLERQEQLNAAAAKAAEEGTKDY